MPSSKTSISSNCFSACSSLSQFTIPTLIKIIENGAFEGCSSLTQIEIPYSVNQIGHNCFDGCTKLEKFSIDPYCTNFYNDIFEEKPALKYLIITNVNKLPDLYKDKSDLL